VFERAAPKSLFSDSEAIARFGVGRNMVGAIRHWSMACGIIKEAEEGYVATQFGHRLLAANGGLDPYCERQATSWLIHWLLGSRYERTTTWFFLFNHVPQQTFDRAWLVKELSGAVQGQSRTISPATLKRDVECCIRSYAPRSGGESVEDTSEPLLGELGLIQQHSRELFEFRRGAKRSLPDGVFVYALLDYWRRLDHQSSVMAFDRVAHDYGSPGRVFKLDEDAVAEHLLGLDDLTGGTIQWTEQAGIRQVTRRSKAMEDMDGMMEEMLEAAYATAR